MAAYASPAPAVAGFVKSAPASSRRMSIIPLWPKRSGLLLMRVLGMNCWILMSKGSQSCVMGLLCRNRCSGTTTCSS